MTDRINQSENQRQERIQPNDIKAIIQKQGKTKIGNEEFTLQQPSATDRELQEIINDPSVTIKKINESKDKREYELNAKGKTIKIKIDVKSIN